MEPKDLPVLACFRHALAFDDDVVVLVSVQLLQLQTNNVVGDDFLPFLDFLSDLMDTL